MGATCALVVVSLVRALRFSDLALLHFVVERFLHPSAWQGWQMLAFAAELDSIGCEPDGARC